MAFQVAESQLGIPPLLDVEDVIRNESPDQFFIMTYVAQFYHKFTAPDSGNLIEGLYVKLIYGFMQAMIQLLQHHSNIQAAKKILREELTT